VRIHGALGPTDTDHFFKIQLGSDTGLRLGLSTESSVAGLQLIRLPDGQGDGSINLTDVLAPSSTLLKNPAMLDLTPGAGSYLVRIYNFFEDPDEYLLELSCRSACPDRPDGRAIPVADGRHRLPPPKVLWTTPE
jgi:hypothetical protein